MNKLSLILECIILLMLPLGEAGAQWYKSFNANHPGELSEAELILSLEKTGKTISRGYTIGAIGGLTAAAGGIVYTYNMIEIENAHYYDMKIYTDRAKLGTYLMAGGIGLMSIGVPLLITGYSRKIEIQIALSGKPATISFLPDLSFERDFFAAVLKLGIRL